MITVKELGLNEDNYNWWLTIMPDVLLNLSILPKATRNSLDYSIESLDVLESYILDNYTLEDARSPYFKTVFDLFIRYVGETVRKNLTNVVWEFQNYDKENVFYGLPILNKNDGKPFSPIYPTFPIAALDRNKGNYMSTVLKNIIKNDTI